jgi:hypothetical protein
MKYVPPPPPGIYFHNAHGNNKFRIGSACSAGPTPLMGVLLLAAEVRNTRNLSVVTLKEERLTKGR